MNKERRVYEKLTPQRKLLYNAVMRNLESDNLEWLQGWKVNGAPISATSGKSYNGLNRMSLMLAAAERGYLDIRWMTFKQMEDKGWSFKRNEEGRSLRDYLRHSGKLRGGYGTQRRYAGSGSAQTI